MVDGSLTFDTKLDTKGFEKGTKQVQNGISGVSSSLKSLAKVAATAFSIKMVADFAKASKEAYNESVQAETKLTTIMKQRMNASDEQIESIKELAAEQQKLGVVEDDVALAGAQQVATFLTETDSIKTLLPAMNDLLAQQNGLNASSGDAVNIANLMGKVLQGQTSALKRVGISFSDAEEQVLKYGSESERAAMLAQVITNNVGHMNQALAQTDAGKQKQLANTIGDVKEQFGQAVMQIESVFLPVIQLLATGLSKIASLAQAAGAAIKEAFGVESADNSATVATNTAAAAAQAADSYEDIAESTETANKEQERSLASFDKINKLSSNSGNSGSSASAGSTAKNTPVSANATKQETSKLISNVKSGLSDLLDWAKKNFGGTFANIWSGISANASESWSNLKQIFSDVKDLGTPLKKYINNDLVPYLNKSIGFMGKVANDTWGIINKVFADIWNIAVYPCLKNFVNVGLPLVTKFWNGVLDVQKAAWDVVVPLFNKLWNDVAKPVLEGIAGLWNDLWTIASELWDEYGQPIFDDICEAIDTIGDILNSLWDSFLKPIWDWLCETIEKLWKNHLAPLVKKIGEFIGQIIQFILKLWNNVLGPIVDWLIKTLGPIVAKIVNAIVSTVSTAIGTIADLIGAIIDVLKGIIKFLTGIFSLDLGKAWDGIKDIFKGAWNAIKAIFEPVAEFFKKVWEWIKTPFIYAASWFKGIFDDVWRFIKGAFSAVWEFFKGLWDTIKSPFVAAAEWFGEKFKKVVEAIKKPFQKIKEFFQDIWSSITGSFNSVSNTLKVEIEKKAQGSNVTIPSIPKFATGTVVPANYGEFAAILGDNKREPEVVSPVSTIEAAVRKVLGEQRSKQPAIINISLDTRNGKRLLTKQVIDDINDIIDSTGVVPINV